MLHVKKVEVPAHTEERVDKKTCDFCGATIPARDYEFAEVTLQCNAGEVYPEGGFGEETIFDCCSTCWVSKVLPALCSLGAEPRTNQWEV